MSRLRRLVRNESGYSLIELMTVMAILGTVVGGLTTVFVRGSAAQLDTNRRVDAQLQATAAFDKLRRDVHCASTATVNGATIALTVPTGCDSSLSIRWCAVASATFPPYALYRKSGATCDATGRMYAGYLTLTGLTRSVLFAYTPPDTSGPDKSLSKVGVDVKVNAPGAKAFDAFELVDDIVLRNSTRS